MADASQALGSPEVAGTFLSPKGTMKKVTTQSAGRMVGGLAGAVGTATGQSLGGQGEGTPTFGQLGYLAVTGDEVALVRAKTGALKVRMEPQAFLDIDAACQMIIGSARSMGLEVVE
jgi:hypothetical protein